MLAVSAYDVVLAIHIMAVVVTFGAVFAYPLMFSVAAKADPRSLPTIHRIETTIERALVNGGLVVVVGAGVFLATDGKHWSEFFVQWGLGAAIVIGGIVGAVMIPASKRAQQLAERDLASGAADGEGEHAWSEEYLAISRRLKLVGSFLSMLVLVTIFVMAAKP